MSRSRSRKAIAMLLALVMLVSCMVMGIPSVSAATGDGQCDLVVTSITTNPANPKPGDQVVFMATIKNQGTSATPAGTVCGVRFSVGGLNTMPFTWNDQYTAAIPAGGEVQLAATGGSNGNTWTAAAAGTYTVYAWVDDANRINESNKNNNQFTTTVTVSNSTPTTEPTTETPTEPVTEPEQKDATDLYLVSLSTTRQTIYKGQEVYGQLMIKNTSDAAKPAGKALSINVYVDGTLNHTISYTGEIAAHGTAMVTTNKWIATLGSHSVRATINADGNIPEGDNTYANKRYSKYIVVENPNPTEPSTEPSTEPPTTPPDPSGTISQKYEAENGTRTGGAGIATEHAGYSGTGFVDRIQAVGDGVTFTNVNVPSSGYYTLITGYAAGPNGFDGNDIRTMSVAANNGEFQQFSFPKTSTSAWNVYGTARGLIYLQAGSNTISYRYQSGDNGNLNLDYMIVEGPVEAVDLTITSLAMKNNTTPGSGAAKDESISFVATVKNQGTGRVAAGTTINVSFVIDGTTIQGSTRLSSALAPNGTVQITSATWKAVEGSMSVTATVDPGNTITEVNKNNNSSTLDFTVSPMRGKDLVISKVYFEGDVQVGNTITVCAEVSNIGTEAVTEGFYTKAVVDGATEIVSPLYTGALAPDAKATIVIGRYVVPAGGAKMVVTVDSTNRVAETNESNNTMSTTVEKWDMDAAWVTYQAEDGTTGGGATVERGTPTKDGTIGTIGGEAVGRAAVKLASTGSYVQWTASEAANSIVLRATIPDVGDNGNGTISVYVNGVKKTTLDVTSKYSWFYVDESYTDEQGYNSALNNPSTTDNGGSPRHIYDECHKLLDFTINAGDVVKLQKDAGDTCEYYGIDFIELEKVDGPKPCPENFLDITKYEGYNGNITTGIYGFIQNWGNNKNKPEYQGLKGLYIPAGRYEMTSQIQMYNVDVGFQIVGAGMWHTVLYTNNGGDSDWGAAGFNMNGHGTVFKDFAFFGASSSRTGSGKPFFNGYGDGTRFENIWIERFTCGEWVGGGSGITTNLATVNCRFRNTGADGINYCNGTKNSVVENTHIRSTGDDGIAIWSAPEMDGPSADISYPGCARNTVRNCRIEAPWRANCLAIYGGMDNTMTKITARDSLTYAGIMVSSEFEPRPFTGTTTVEKINFERCGGWMWGRRPFGAIWVRCYNNAKNPVKGINFKDINITDAWTNGIVITMERNNSIEEVVFENVNVNGFNGSYGILIEKDTQPLGDGSGVTFRNCQVAGTGTKFMNQIGSSFAVTKSGCNF